MGSVVKRFLLFTIMAFLLITGPGYAEMEISQLEIKPVVSNEFIVQYAWTIAVQYDRDEKGSCVLEILFFDASGSQIHSQKRAISLNKGLNQLGGRGVCKPGIWKRIREYKAHITCS